MYKIGTDCIIEHEPLRLDENSDQKSRPLSRWVGLYRVLSNNKVPNICVLPNNIDVFQ